MKNIFLRTKQLATYVVENKSTVRLTAKVFGLAKSTVHYDLTHRLPIIDNNLYKQVRIVLDQNFEEKSKRGGIATRNKYLKVKN